MTPFGTASDGSTILYCTQYTPAGQGPFPTIAQWHGGGFRSGAAGPATPCNDLAAAGFLVFAFQHRLAAASLPPPDMPQQTASHGFYPDQIADAKLAVQFARTHPLSNGKVGGLGGSSGASHAMVCALSGTPGDDMLDCMVGLSGAYDYGDPASLADASRRPFKVNVGNYVQSNVASVLHAASPVMLATASSGPIYLIASDNDSMPLEQLPDMLAALAAAGASNVTSKLRSGNQHSFSYWQPEKTDIIAFFQENL